MPAPIPGQPEAQGQEPAPDQGQPQGKATEIVTRIHEDMMQLLDLMQNSKAVGPQDIKAFQGLIQGYEQFVQNNLGSGGGDDQGEQEAPPGPSTPEAGGNPN